MEYPLLTSPPKEIDRRIKEKLFDALPFGFAVIDRRCNLVHANGAFEEMFGPWQGAKCHQVYKNSDSACEGCGCTSAFASKAPAVSQQTGVDRTGKPIRYTRHIIPIENDNGDVTHLMQMCTNVTEMEQIRQEYQLLFDQVPCSILVIDRNFRIVRANAQAKRMLGEIEGMRCYRGLKNADERCSECTARKTFEDGGMHRGHHAWQTKEGKSCHLHVITVPLAAEDGGADMVMEMAVDVTETLELKDGLDFANTFLQTVINTSMDGILAVDENGDATICNPAARTLFKMDRDCGFSDYELAGMLPEGCIDRVMAGRRRVFLPETTITDAMGNRVPVRLVGNQLLMDGRFAGMAFSIQDLRQIKSLQNEKLEAERMATVGQTVAGLAHGVKNLLNALEGGMYMLNTGLSKGKVDRVQKGLEMLDRNIERISMFVKAFLDFAKGRQIRAGLNDPSAIAKEVVEMYAAKAKSHGIRLKTRTEGPIPKAAIDYESMHECLTNLVGNAIDACSMSEEVAGTSVIVRIFEKNRVIHYEVTDDGCGMDYEVKKKVFTNFFTTKGLGGTGLGLLMTKKIIQEHGGTIDLSSEPGEGTTFRIRLPRSRLPVVDTET